MNYQRITVSLPKNVYEDLIKLIGKGRVSAFVADATEEKILDKKLEPKDPIETFLALRKKTKKISDSEIMAAIRKGRT